MLEDHYLPLSPYNLCHVSRRRERVFSRFYCSPSGRPKNRRGRGRQERRESPSPISFLFESPTPFDAATPAICPTTPQAKNKTAVNVSLEIISLHSASNLRRCLSLLSETWVTFYDFQVFSWVLSYLPLRGWGRLWYCLLGAFLIPGSFNSRSFYKWRMTILFVNFFIYFENKFT